MAFIVKKNISGKDYYYLNETRREGTRVVSKCLAYLGKNRGEAEKRAKEVLETLKEKQSILGKDFSNDSTDEGNTGAKKESCIQPIKISIEDLAMFCKENGFVFRSSDIYGGYAGFWDFGPLGVELFNNIKKEWWNFFVQQKNNMLGMEASIISHPRTWKASGHIENFNDIFVKCKKCKKTGKLDPAELGIIKCDCGGEYESLGKFNLMFSTKIGAVDTETAFLRGETAQGMFMDFKLIHQTSRAQLPFGIAQIGRCFRNEIAPRDFLFRSREFNIGEFEFFIHPDEKKCDLLDEEHLNVKFNFLDAETQKQGKTDLKEVAIREILGKGKLDEWHAYWLAEQIIWFRNMGLDEIKIREHTKEELSHYSSATFDIDYEYPFGSKEVAGNANRGQYDLTQHAKESKQKMEIFDEKTKMKVIPRVIEPTFGIERVFLAVLTKAYSKNEKGEVVLRIPAKLAPIKAAVFPIVKQPEFEELAEKIYIDLKKEWKVVYDKGGSIGRRYARNDEVGTPYCITIDEDSVKNQDVTIRDRNTTKQVRVKVSDLKEVLRKLINKEIKFEKSGSSIE